MECEENSTDPYAPALSLLMVEHQAGLTLATAAADGHARGAQPPPTPRRTLAPRPAQCLAHTCTGWLRCASCPTSFSTSARLRWSDRAALRQWPPGRLMSPP